MRVIAGLKREDLSIFAPLARYAFDPPPPGGGKPLAPYEEGRWRYVAVPGRFTAAREARAWLEPEPAWRARRKGRRVWHCGRFYLVEKRRGSPNLRALVRAGGQFRPGRPPRFTPAPARAYPEHGLALPRVFAKEDTSHAGTGA